MNTRLAAAYRFQAGPRSGVVLHLVDLDGDVVGADRGRRPAPVDKGDARTVALWEQRTRRLRHAGVDRTDTVLVRHEPGQLVGPEPESFSELAWSVISSLRGGAAGGALGLPAPAGDQPVNRSPQVSGGIPGRREVRFVQEAPG